MRAVALFLFIFLSQCPLVSATPLEDLLVKKGLLSQTEIAELTPAVEPKVYWNDGVRIEFPDNMFNLQLTTFIKNAYVYTDAPSGSSDTSSFDVRAARLVLSGNALKKEFIYKVEYDVKLERVLDGYLGWNATKWLELRMGQYKTGISRQYVNSSFKLMFPDASAPSNYYNYGYQGAFKGIAKLLGDELNLAVAISNGNSFDEGAYGSGHDTMHMITTDLRWSPIGRMNAYDESDIDFTENPAASFGAVYAHSPQETKVRDTVQDLDVNRVSMDANFKYRGLGLNAEYYVSHEDPSDGASWTTHGAYAQGGYFVLPKKLEILGRWGMIDCSNGNGLGTCQGVDQLNQLTTGVNYYFHKHNAKVQAAFDYMHSDIVERESKNQRRWILQVVGIF